MKEKGITGSTLKIIAIVTMLIDHIGAAIVERMLMSGKYGLIQISNPVYVTDMILRGIGRIAFPIFCFLLVEGFLHTANVWKYALRLFLFAMISEIPFDLAFLGKVIYPGCQNVFFTLLIGLLVMIAFSLTDEKWNKKVLKVTAKILSFAAGFFLAEFLHTDYGGIGIICIMVLYLFRFNRTRQILFGALSFLWEITAPLAFLPISHYNGKRGIRNKYFFYIFYPVHLLILFFIAWLLGLVQ